MPPPEDAAKVLKAVRLGWAVAEVRGRNRPDAPSGARARLPGPPSHALRLGDEQTPAELRIKAQWVLAGMARDLGVDTDAKNDSHTDVNNDSYAEAIDSQAKALHQARKDAAEDNAASDPAAQWDVLQQLIFRFDAHIQDALAAQSDTVAYGYQLGRALAECYWALAPNAYTESSASWEFLLGPSRCAAISRLVGDLSAYFLPYTAAAVAGSVQVWKHFAADREWRKSWRAEHADDDLYAQINRWYGLIVIGRDPMTLVQPYARLRGVTPRVIRYYLPQITLLVLGVVALVALVSSLSSGTGGTLLSVVLGIVGAVGLSAGGLSAGRFRQSLNADLAAIAATIPPPMPPERRSRQAARIAKMVRERPTNS